MKNRQESRNSRPGRLPTALLLLALFAGTASVGYTQEIPSLVITAQRPVHVDYSASIRDEIRERTQIAVWMTRISVGTDLGLKLARPGRRYRLAASDAKKRG